MTNDNSKPPLPSVGVSLDGFDAALAALDELQRGGKVQLFLTRGNSVRFIGDIHHLHALICKKLGLEPEASRAQKYLLEIQMFLQVAISTEQIKHAVDSLEKHVYEDEFTAAGTPEAAATLRACLTSKFERIYSLNCVASMRQRLKRLQTVVGPTLEDMDTEIVSTRSDSTQAVDINTPFLRLRLRYSSSEAVGFPFAFPPWFTNSPKNIKGFELECDETDIDVLIARLLQAKEKLSYAIAQKANVSA